MKEISASNCGRKDQFCEAFIKAPAQRAEEPGVETDIIRAMFLKVLPCTGCNGCLGKGACAHMLVFGIGDCKSFGKVTNVIESAYGAAMEIVEAAPPQYQEGDYTYR